MMTMRRSTTTFPASRAAAMLLGLGLGFGVAVAGGGCGEQPAPGASRDTGPREGGSRSTLGRARDRAESVIQDVEEYDQRRMDMIDEMNGVDPASRDDADAHEDGRDPDGG